MEVGNLDLIGHNCYVLVCPSLQFLPKPNSWVSSHLSYEETHPLSLTPGQAKTKAWDPVSPCSLSKGKIHIQMMWPRLTSNCSLSNYLHFHQLQMHNSHEAFFIGRKKKEAKLVSGGWCFAECRGLVVVRYVALKYLGRSRGCAVFRCIFSQSEWLSFWS